MPHQLKFRISWWGIGGALVGHWWGICLLCSFPTIESKEFPPERQRAVLAATVRVIDGENRRQGTGTLVGVRDGVGYVLTARHVVARSTKVEVEFFAGETYPKPSGTVRADRRMFENAVADLALLTVPLKEIEKVPEPVAIRREELKEKEFAALSIGASGGEAPTPEAVAVKGRKLIERPDGSRAFFWQMRPAPIEGRSGGPLIDAEGQLIGVISGEQLALGYAGHRDEIVPWLRKANEGKLRWLLASKKNE